jgi:uncharacterized protein YbjT (DUF2867 family)
VGRIAILAGGTGLVGSHCLRELVRSDRYERIFALVRSGSAAQHCGVVRTPINFDRIESAALPEDADVFCALGTTIKKAGSQEAFRRVDFDYVVGLARRAAACHARQLCVVSSVAADAGSNNFYLRVKGEMEAAVSALPFEGVHVFRPSFLIGTRAESRHAEAAGILAARALQFLLLGSWRRYRPIEASTVGRSMVAAAEAELRGRFVQEYDGMLSLAASKPAALKQETNSGR